MAERDRSQREEFAEEEASLWRITFGPLIWAIHFAASYGFTALFCAKWGLSDVSFLWLRAAIAGSAALSLLAIGWIGWRAWVQWDFLTDWDYEHNFARGEDRHEFLGHAAFLLAIVSFVGVCYTALPALLIGSCR